MRTVSRLPVAPSLFRFDKHDNGGDGDINDTNGDDEDDHGDDDDDGDDKDYDGDDGDVGSEDRAKSIFTCLQLSHFCVNS